MTCHFFYVHASGGVFRICPRLFVKSNLNYHHMAYFLIQYGEYNVFKEIPNFELICALWYPRNYSPWEHYDFSTRKSEIYNFVNVACTHFLQWRCRLECCHLWYAFKHRSHLSTSLEGVHKKSVIVTHSCFASPVFSCIFRVEMFYFVFDPHIKYEIHMTENERKQKTSVRFNTTKL